MRFATEDQSEAHRFYEIPPLDRTGLLFGFGFGEMILVGVVSTLCVLLLQLGVPFWIYSPILLISVVVIRKPWPGGLQLAEYLPIAQHRLANRRQKGEWRAERPWTGTSGDLPPSLAGIELASVRPAGYRDVGIVVDPVTGAGTFVVELGSTSFLLEPEEEQSNLLDRWGRTIGASVVAGQSEVLHVSFTLISSQGSPKDHMRFVQQSGGEVVPQRMADEYSQLIYRGTQRNTSHRILFSVTVGARKQSTTAGWGLDEDGVTDASVVTAGRAAHYREIARTVTSTMSNLKSLGWTEQRPLTSAELLDLVGECVDPGTRLGRVAQSDRSLDAVLGIQAKANPPTRLLAEREFVVINGVSHRSFWVRTWPNYGLAPDWMIQLLSEVDGERRFTVFFRPVPKSESVKTYERQMGKHDGDVIAAKEKGKRVSLNTLKAQQTVAELGEDLMAGFPEVELGAVVTISGANPKVLRQRSDAFASLAISSGLQVSPLRDAHELGWTHSTPFGFCPLKIRSAWN